MNPDSVRKARIWLAVVFLVGSAVGERAAGQDGAGRACLPSGRRAAQRCILCTSPRCRGWCCPGAEHRAQGRSSLGRRADQQDEFAASTADLPPRPGAAAAFHEDQVPQFPLDRRLVAEPDLQAVSDLGTPERCLPSQPEPPLRLRGGLLVSQIAGDVRRPVLADPCVHPVLPKAAALWLESVLKPGSSQGHAR